MTAPFLLSRAVEAAISPTQTSYITHERVTLMNNMSSILAGIALLLCMAVIGFTFVLWLDREARKCLDRVSFRLIVYSLLSNCIYCIGYIICVQVGPGFWCVAGVWLIQFWLGITNWLITFVALNLQLVLVHHCNGIKLEKYYLLFTVFINLAITLPPLIKGKFGWDPVIKVCWLTSDNDDDRLRWQISTQLAWILFTIFLTTLASIVTIGHLYKHKFTSIRVLNGNNGNQEDSQRTDLSLEEIPKRRRRSLTSLHHGVSRNLMSNQEFRKIILRISIYPIVMIILNLIITIADIRISTSSGIYTSLDYGIYVIYYALYGARGIFYALIAVADPALMRAYKVWRGGKNSSGGTQITALDTAAETGTKNPYGTPTELAGINVQTEIESYVQETKIYHDFAHNHPMPNAAGEATTNGLVTHIESSHIPTKPANVYTRQSNPDMRNESSSGVKRQQPNWKTAPSESEMSFADERDPDECSISSLAPHPDVVGDVESLGISGIRKRQLAKLARRKDAEREMKRQI